MPWKVNSNDKDKKEEYVDIGDVFKNKDTKKNGRVFELYCRSRKKER